MHASRLYRVLILLLAGGYLAYGLSTLPTTAPTFDEVAHLPAGYAAWRLEQGELNQEHPPLAKLLASLPLALWISPSSTLREASHTLSEWDFGRTFLYQSPYSPDLLITLGRLPMLLLGLALAGLTSRLALRLGSTAGVAAFFLVAFCPIVMAHARLVTTDVPVATFAVLSSLLLVRLRSRQGWGTSCLEKGWLELGLALGATLATKFTAVVFVPALLVADFVTLRRASRRTAVSWSVGALAARLARLWVPASVIALGFVLASYGWPLDLMAWPRGMAKVGFNHMEGYRFYMLGRFQEGGFPLYFPIAFLLKSSPAVLVLGSLSLLMAMAQWLKAKRGSTAGPSSGYPGGSSEVGALPALEPTGDRRDAGAPQKESEEVRRTGGGFWPYILFPGGAYLVAVLAWAPDIGVRYVIPVLPFLYVVLASRVQRLASTWEGRSLLALLALVHAFSAYRAWPDPVSYFNGMLGCEGTAAITCLDDSNVDWGQDLGRIAPVVERMRRADEVVRLGYLGTADPRFYLKRWRRALPLELSQPEDALYVVSAQWFLRARLEVDEWAPGEWQPVEVVGNTFMIFDHRRKR